MQTVALTVAKTGTDTGKVSSAQSGIMCGSICLASFPYGKGWSRADCNGTALLHPDPEADGRHHVTCARMAALLYRQVVMAR